MSINIAPSVSGSSTHTSGNNNIEAGIQAGGGHLSQVENDLKKFS